MPPTTFSGNQKNNHWQKATNTPWKDVSNAKAARQSLAFSQQPKGFGALILGRDDVSKIPEITGVLNCNNIFETSFRRNGEMVMASNRFASGLTKQLANEYDISLDASTQAQSAVGQISLNYIYFSFTLPETNSHSPWK